MTRNRRKLVIALGVVIAVLIGAFALPPRAVVWAPLTFVRCRLLMATPIGTERSAVTKYLEEHRYRISETGSDSERRVPGYPIDEPFAKYLKADVGRYRVGFRTDVEAIYTFDSADKLRNVVVRRYIDAP